MREIALFVEDYAHRQFVGALLERPAHERGIDMRPVRRNATGGHGKVARKFDRYLRDIRRQSGSPPDLIVVATDANCGGPNARAAEFPDDAVSVPLARDPRPAYRTAGYCSTAPRSSVWLAGGQCDRGRYKHLPVEAIRAAGIGPGLGGLGFAEDLAHEMDLARAARADKSFKRFVDALDDVFQGWDRP